MMHPSHSGLVEPTPLSLGELAAGRVVAHGVAGYPHEVCGILIGVDQPEARLVVDAIAVENVWVDDEEKCRRFTIDPRRQLELERALEGTGKMIVGFYHSHPDHPAVPSAFDLEAAWAFYSYLIVGIDHGRIGETRSWRLDDAGSRFVEQKIVRP